MVEGKMEYELKNGRKFEISYSQELQEQHIKQNKQIKVIGIIGLIVLIFIAIFLGIIIFTNVLQDSLRMMVCWNDKQIYCIVVFGNNCSIHIHRLDVIEKWWL